METGASDGTVLCDGGQLFCVWAQEWVAVQSSVCIEVVLALARGGFYSDRCGSEFFVIIRRSGRLRRTSLGDDASIFTKEADIDASVNFASNSSFFWLESINLKIANVLQACRVCCYKHG